MENRHTGEGTSLLPPNALRNRGALDFLTADSSIIDGECLPFSVSEELNSSIVEFIEYESKETNWIGQQLVEQEMASQVGKEKEDREAIQLMEKLRRQKIAKKFTAGPQSVSFTSTVYSLSSHLLPFSPLNDNSGEKESTSGVLMGSSPLLANNGAATADGGTPKLSQCFTEPGMGTAGGVSGMVQSFDSSKSSLGQLLQGLPSGSPTQPLTVEMVLKDSIIREASLQDALRSSFQGSSIEFPNRASTAPLEAVKSVETAPAVPPRNENDALPSLDSRGAPSSSSPVDEATEHKTRHPLFYLAPVYEAAQEELLRRSEEAVNDEPASKDQRSQTKTLSDFSCYDGRDIVALSSGSHGSSFKKRGNASPPFHNGAEFLASVPSGGITANEVKPLLGDSSSQGVGGGQGMQRRGTQGSFTVSNDSASVAQHLWISTLVRQQIFLLLSGLFWGILFFPNAILIAASSSSTPSSGYTSLHLLHMTVELGAACFTLFLLVFLPGGGQWILCRPSSILMLLFLGVLLSVAGVILWILFSTPFGEEAILLVPIQLLGKALKGVGEVMAVLGLMGVSAAETGVGPGVTLQLQLALLVYPATYLFSVVTVPFLTTFFWSEKALSIYSLAFLGLMAFIVPLLLCVLVTPRLLSQAVLQHKLFFASSLNITFRSLIPRLSPGFLLRVGTTAFVIGCSFLMIELPQQLLAKIHNGSHVNPFNTLIILFLSMLLLWPCCFIPLIVPLVRAWFPVIASVLLSWVSWCMYNQWDIIRPEICGGFMGAAVVVVTSSLIRTLIHAGAPFGDQRRSPLSTQQRPQGGCSNNSRITEHAAAINRGYGGVEACDAVLVEQGEQLEEMGSGSGIVNENRAACFTGAPLVAMLLTAVCAASVLVLLALISALTWSISRDVEEYPSHSSVVIAPGVTEEMNRALVRVVGGLGGMALLFQLLEVLVHRNQWDHLLPTIQCE